MDTQEIIKAAHDKAKLDPNYFGALAGYLESMLGQALDAMTPEQREYAFRYLREQK